MKEEDRHAERAELAGQAAQPVDLLLHRVADKDERVDLGLAGLADRVLEHPLDLGLAADAKDRAHDAVQIGGGSQPAARLALVEPAIIDELNVEPAERGGRLEHLALDAAGAVPGRFAAGGGVEREDQPPAPARIGRGAPFSAFEKLLDLGRARLGQVAGSCRRSSCPSRGPSHTEVS